MIKRLCFQLCLVARQGREGTPDRVAQIRSIWGGGDENLLKNVALVWGCKPRRCQISAASLAATDSAGRHQERLGPWCLFL